MGSMVAKVLQREVQRTEPDYVAHVPKSWDDSTDDSHNEHSAGHPDAPQPLR